MCGARENGQVPHVGLAVTCFFVGNQSPLPAVWEKATVGLRSLIAQQEQEEGELRCTLCLEGLQASGGTGWAVTLLARAAALAP